MRAKPQPRCEHCGKRKDQHSARLLECPTRPYQRERWGKWHAFLSFKPTVRQQPHRERGAP